MGNLWKWDNITFHNKKVSQSHHRPRCPEGSRKLSFPDYVTMAQDGVKVVSLSPGRFLPPINIPGSHFSYTLSRSQENSAIGRIMSMKNSIDTIWNEPSDLYHSTLTTVLPRSDSVYLRYLKMGCKYPLQKSALWSDACVEPNLHRQII